MLQRHNIGVSTQAEQQVKNGISFISIGSVPFHCQGALKENRDSPNPIHGRRLEGEAEELSTELPAQVVSLEEWVWTGLEQASRTSPGVAQGARNSWVCGGYGKLKP